MKLLRTQVHEIVGTPRASYSGSVRNTFRRTKENSHIHANCYSYGEGSRCMSVHEDKKYDLFISYNKADAEFTERLVKRVEAESWRGRSLRCFYADWDIAAGENILLKIEQAQQDSRFIALVMSPEWQKSDWTTLERVIPVYEDPAGLKARIIPILRRDCEIPPSIRILKWLDFRNDSNFEKEAKKLVTRLTGQTDTTSSLSGTTRNISRFRVDTIGPDLQNETLASNLFLVLQIPRYVYVADSRIKKRDEIWTKLGENAALPPFAVHKQTGRIFSFADLQTFYRLDELLVEPVMIRMNIVDLIANGHASILIDILNRSMTAHMKNLGMVYDWNNKKTFFPLGTDLEEIRYGSWKVGNREFKRILVRRSKTKEPYYVHRSCKATFTLIGDRLYLKLVPGWHFTTDGHKVPVSQYRMRSLSSRWMNLERNHSVLDDVRFWAYILSCGSDQIVLDVGCKIKTVIASIPIFASIDRGIEWDYRERLWYEQEPESDELEVAYENEVEVKEEKME